jgi:hypothetical protein
LAFSLPVRELEVGGGYDVFKVDIFETSDMWVDRD